MKPTLLASLAFVALAVPLSAQAQTPVIQTLSGTRLDLNVTGEVSRVPDIAVISAGVVTRSQTASGAISQNAARMERVRAALKQAGIADRDIQTSSINLNPEYRYQDNQAPQLIAYSASNQVNIRFRDIRNSGAILDALVAQGANQINGPSLTIDKPETALDEARAKALAVGRARADLYARSLGMRVVRLVSVTEGGRLRRPPADRDDAGGGACGWRCGHQDRSRRAAIAGHAIDEFRTSMNMKKAAWRVPRGLHQFVCSRI